VESRSQGAAPWGSKVRALSFSNECYAWVVCLSRCCRCAMPVCVCVLCDLCSHSVLNGDAVSGHAFRCARLCAVRCPPRVRENKGDFNWVSSKRRDRSYVRHKSPTISSSTPSLLPPRNLFTTSSRSSPHQAHKNAVPVTINIHS
jgi:hypothetical protein